MHMCACVCASMLGVDVDFSTRVLSMQQMKSERSVAAQSSFDALVKYCETASRFVHFHTFTVM